MKEENKYYLACVTLCDKLNQLDSVDGFYSVNQEANGIYYTTLYKIEHFADIWLHWEKALADKYLDQLDYERYVIQQVLNDKDKEISKLQDERTEVIQELVQTEELIKNLIEQYPKLKERYDTKWFLPF